MLYEHIQVDLTTPHVYRHNKLSNVYNVYGKTHSSAGPTGISKGITGHIHTRFVPGFSPTSICTCVYKRARKISRSPESRRNDPHVQTVRTRLFSPPPKSLVVRGYTAQTIIHTNSDPESDGLLAI